MNRIISLSVLAMLALAISTSKSHAQIDPSNRPVQMYKDCFNDSIQRNSVSKRGDSLIFTCSGDVARTFYDTLGQYGYQTTSFESQGRAYNVRYTTDSRDDGCFLQIQDQGRTTQVFSCQLFFTAGPFINR